MNTDFEQLSGFKKIEFFKISETANWPVVLTDATAAQVTHDPSVIDSFGLFQDEVIDVPDNPKESVNGLVYPIDINFSFLNRTEDLEQYLDSYQNIPLVVIAELQTGIKKIYGTNEEPLFLIWKNIDGKKVEDLGTVTLNIKGETRNRPVFYSV